jgi:hypothetical protein
MMKHSEPSQRPKSLPQWGLGDLPKVSLTPDQQHYLDRAHANSAGPTSWRCRKLAEAKDLMALCQIAPPGRLRVVRLDLRQNLRTTVRLAVPVPCRPTPDGQLRIAHLALLGITYPAEALRRPLPGYAFVQIQAPHSVWHANAAPDLGQPLCLGAQLPAGIRVKELVLMSYGALSMQTVMIDEGDAAGVLNPAAARWWQENLHRVPLTQTPFLSPDGLKGR